MTIELIPNVSDIQSRKSLNETYQFFHELYSPKQLESRGFSTVLNRILDDLSTHVVIAKREIPGERILPILRMPRGDLWRYNHAEVKVALTNGETISEYKAVGVYGICRALNGRLRPRKLGPEEMVLKFISDEGSHVGSAEFDRASGEGKFNFGSNGGLSILGAAESYELRQHVLTSDPISSVQGTVAS